MIENAGQNGFSIVVCEWQGVVNFWLQARGLTSLQCEKFRQVSKDFGAMKNIRMAEGKYVNYCPHCGRKTLKLVKKYPKEYHALIEKHKTYVSDIGDILYPPEYSQGIGDTSSLVNNGKAE